MKKKIRIGPVVSEIRWGGVGMAPPHSSTLYKYVSEARVKSITTTSVYHPPGYTYIAYSQLHKWVTFRSRHGTCVCLISGSFPHRVTSVFGARRGSKVRLSGAVFSQLPAAPRATLPSPELTSVSVSSICGQCDAWGATRAFAEIHWPVGWRDLIYVYYVCRYGVSSSGNNLSEIGASLAL